MRLTIWEMSYPGDGRVTLRHGSERRMGETQVIWSGVGGHEIFSRPQWP